ncbi:MAG TPA: 16S rRNA (cytosine(1402)-N(4))-methyltransferase RsmH [Chthoniobacterales bacterium]
MPEPHRRRVRYSGKYPRRFEDKYKEFAPEKYPETVAKVVASGKTPAGSHRPIMVSEILAVLDPKPGETAVDCTLGYGGHAREILSRLRPGGRLIGLDVDPVEQPHTEERLRALGFGPDEFLARRSNFAGLPKVLAAEGLAGADCILADLGVSSMQIDTPIRGFSTKTAGPLDMRMNPQKGLPASELLARLQPRALGDILRENADEPRAALLSEHLAGKNFTLTTDLAEAIRSLLPHLQEDERDRTVRRVFQALRIAVNEEFTALDALLRHLPQCLNPDGRVAILTFHSGEDRRVKKAFQSAYREGLFSRIADEIIRPTPEECRANPRSTSAKLRWAKRASAATD